jgi:hypothetical protein
MDLFKNHVGRYLDMICNDEALNNDVELFVRAEMGDEAYHSAEFTVEESPTYKLYYALLGEAHVQFALRIAQGLTNLKLTQK